MSPTILVAVASTPTATSVRSAPASVISTVVVISMVVVIPMVVVISTIVGVWLLVTFPRGRPAPAICLASTAAVLSLVDAVCVGAVSPATIERGLISRIYRHDVF